MPIEASTASSALARVAERVAPLAPKEPRKANQLDKLRVAEIARRIDAGEDELAAGWAVLSDPKLGIARWRGAPASERPHDVALARKVAALLRRAVPALLEQARDVTLARVAGLSDKAVRTLDEVASGDFDDPARARVQLDGAKALIEALGIGGRAGGVSSTTNVVLSLGDGLRALRGATIEAHAVVTDTVGTDVVGTDPAGADAAAADAKEDEDAG